MKVRFWGVRGSVASAGPQTRKVGGNTTCVEIESGGRRLILDAGTGIRGLGDSLMAEALERGEPVRAHLLFSHLHWDHVQGFPFFSPAYVSGTELTLHGFGPGPSAGEEGAGGLEATLSRQMTAPNFPVPLEAMGAQMTFGRIADRTYLELGPFEVLCRRLVHPQGCLGFRIEAEGHSVCFATDTEQREGRDIDPALLELARDVDLLILDAQYTPDEYAGRVGPPRQGWGHSTHRVAAQVAKACGARALALFHHDPGHDDAFVEAMERDARADFSWTRAAREGEEVVLS